MLASGQIGFDYKNDFIKRNNVKKAAYIPDKSPPPEIRVPEVQMRQKPPPTDNPSIAPPYPEDSFKNVRHHLKLNQSAMAPDRELIADQKFSDLADKSDSVLLKVGTVWPFTFFVNKIIIDPFKVNVIFKEFFWSERIHSIMIKDILDVVVETSIFFATVKIVDQGYVTNTVDIAYLKRADAMMVRKIIQGLVIAHRQSVDLSVLQTSHIRDKAEELGKVKGIDKESDHLKL